MKKCLNLIEVSAIKKAPTTPRNYFLYFNLTFIKALAAEMILFVKIEIEMFFCLPVVVERHDHETRSASNRLVSRATHT